MTQKTKTNPTHLTPILSAQEWRRKLNVLTPSLKEGGQSLAKGLELWRQTVESFGPENWRSLLTFQLIILATIEGDPQWRALPRMGEILRVLDTEATGVDITCHKCERLIGDAQFLSYRGEPICKICASQLPPNDKASVKVHSVWR